jgi:bis(5'-nucleosyl)-tetraphosphatase (symmetrical)
MSLYLIGDVQGCNKSLGKLLELIDFSASKDTAYFLGDLINRGPDNVGVIRRLMDMGTSAQCILGNHDLHFLAVEQDIRSIKRGDTVQDLLHAPDRLTLTHWIRHQSLALEVSDYLLVHAGVLPSWSAEQTMALAQEVESALRGPHYTEFLLEMYGNEPSIWIDQLQGFERLRVIVNVLTRMRFCTPEGQLDFNAKSGLENAPAGFMPWFDVPSRASADTKIAFGHWSTAGGIARNGVVCVDTGCVWGRELSALQIPSTLAGEGLPLWPTDHMPAQHTSEGVWFKQPSLEPHIEF